MPEVRRSKDLSGIMGEEILSLSVTFVNYFELYIKKNIEQSIDITKLEALMSWKIPLFESQLLIRKFHRRSFPPETLT